MKGSSHPGLLSSGEHRDRIWAPVPMKAPVRIDKPYLMFGHVDNPTHWAQHLLDVKGLQRHSGGITEFVPLPFVAAEAPLYRRGHSRAGPTLREALLMHAVARQILHLLIKNIQASWVKLGPEGVATCLAAGVNDLGGTLMDESISRAAGASHGQEMRPKKMERLIETAGRKPRQRTTFYGEVPAERLRAGRQAANLIAVASA